MEKIPLGRTTEKIPKIGFGMWQFSPNTGVIQRAVALDADFVDIAEADWAACSRPWNESWEFCARLHPTGCQWVSKLTWSA